MAHLALKWHGAGERLRDGWPAQHQSGRWPAVLMGAPGRIRTRDPLLRRQLLYPAELQAPTERIVQYPGHAEATSPGQRP